MSWISWLEKIATIGFILCFIISIYYGYISRKNKIMFFEDLIDELKEDDPDVIVSDEVTIEYMDRFNQMCMKPVMKDTIFRILYIIFGCIASLTRTLK